MGYNTKFKGELIITPKLNATQIEYGEKFFGNDIREDWPKNRWSEKIQWIHLKFSENCCGIQWDGSEKTYDMEYQVNYIISVMKGVCPEFTLSGKLFAQGVDDVDDRWELIINDSGIAEIIDIPPTGKHIICPYCEGHFHLDSIRDSQPL